MSCEFNHLRKMGMNWKEAILACLIVPSQRFHGEVREDSKLWIKSPVQCYGWVCNLYLDQ
jgi:hypothetical protein